MKKVNRMIAIMLSVLLLAAAFCMTACKDDKKNPDTPTTTTKPNPGNDTRKNPNTTPTPALSLLKRTGDLLRIPLL